MDFNCPHCNQRFHNDTPCAGRIITCPTCHQNFEILNPDGSRAKKNCPYCGEEILAVAQKCPHCKEMLNEKLHQSDESRVIYCLLGLFLGGLGAHNFSRGKSERNVGILHLVLTIMAIGVIAGWGERAIGAFCVLFGINTIWILVEIINGKSLV